MSSAQVLYSETGDFVGSWRPHLMIYYPYLTQEDVGGDAGLDGALVSDPGGPLANILVVVPRAVDPVVTSATGGG